MSGFSSRKILVCSFLNTVQPGAALLVGRGVDGWLARSCDTHARTTRRVSRALRTHCVRRREVGYLGQRGILLAVGLAQVLPVLAD
jgi:hypothetical protein